MAKKQQPKRSYDLPISIEQLVLAGVQKIGDDATAMSVFEILQPIYHSLAFPSVYTALERMTWKGYLECHLGDPEPRRGGRARNLYRLTKLGREVLSASYEIHENISKMLNPVKT